jgi:hypothetical protein
MKTLFSFCLLIYVYLKHSMKKMFLYCFIIMNVGISCKNGADKPHHKPANQTEANIYRCSDSMLAAFKRKDWPAFAQFNHPAMMKMMGGQQAFASFIGEQMKQIPDTAIKKLETGKILQVVKTNKDQQCVVEQKMEMHLEGTTISSTTYLIGESLDGGKNWTFFDASTKAMAPKDIKPDISPELKIPEKKQEIQE